MADIYLHSRHVDSIFQLLGEHENDISYSVAWALSQCPSFLQRFLHAIVGISAGFDGTIIRLQQHESKGGFTDIEIEMPNQFYLIIEAKRGWNLPNRKQLEMYSRRRSFIKSTASKKLLIVLSECSQEYAKCHLDPKVDDIVVEPISWKAVALFAKKSQTDGCHAEKRLLQELITYLGGLMTMQTIDSNWVYVVSLSSRTEVGWAISWIDIVTKRALYFHPVSGSGWPKEPPNYIAFRYHGKLQSIHHIEGYEVVTNMHGKIPEIPEEEWPPHFLYSLGPAFGPHKEVKTGNIYPNGRVWCMLDTLFTCETISAARDVSKERAEGKE